MNILILTPDAVGSTLLQRLITIYCQFQEFSDTYINVHELTNGLSKFYSHDFNSEILQRDSDLEYSQSLPAIIKILDSIDHKIIARIAQYHLLRRRDPKAELSHFYKFCNENFFIIATRRTNVFEYALSQYINRITKRLNVYSPNEKINAFENLYQSPISVDLLALKHILEQYKNYVKWSEKFFDISSYFDYTNDINNIEQYILNLPVFAEKSVPETWASKFGIDFKQWNLCHLLTSDLDNVSGLDNLPHERSTFQSYLALEQYYDKDIVENYHAVADPSWPQVHNVRDYANLPAPILQECHEVHKIAGLTEYQHNLLLIQQLPQADQFFLKKHQATYLDGINSMKKMVSLGILPGSLPIKKQTLAGKSRLIKNFDQCLETYNHWSSGNQEICQPTSVAQLESMMQQETAQWRAPLLEELGGPTNQMIDTKS